MCYIVKEIQLFIQLKCFLVLYFCQLHLGTYHLKIIRDGDSYLVMHLYYSLIYKEQQK